MNIGKFCGIVLAAACYIMPSLADAAPIESIRSSISPARVRLVLDSKEAINYKAEKDGKELIIEMPDSTAKKQQPVVKDPFIRKVKLEPEGKKGSKLQITLAKDCQYKIYQLKGPDRLVIDIFRINIIKESKQLAKGVTYTYLQDELNGKQIQGYLLSVDKKADYELRPFSAAGSYNGRGYVSKRAAQLGLLAAVNASYFDSDGWVIGVVKDRGEIYAMDAAPHSGYVSDGKNQTIVKDIAYTGMVKLPGGKTLTLKGMNRARIAEDLVLYNEYYAASTRTNQFGREIKLRNGRVIAVSTAGNMSIEPGTQVISGHGSNAATLAGVRVGDRVSVSETLGSEAADKARVVIGGGPLLLEDGRVNVRSREENIAADIARGRAPRTAIGVKKDGTLLVLVVDGRNSASSGLTLEELAQYFLRLGARDAVNFDGGGSSVMVVNKSIVNKPSDGRERAVSIGAGLFPRY